MQTLRGFVVVVILLAAGCKGKAKDGDGATATGSATDPTSGSAATGSAATGSAATGSAATDSAATDSAGAGSAAISLAAGESLEPSADFTLNGTNPLAWKVSPTVTVTVGITFKEETARVVAAMPGAADVELGTVEFNSAYSGSYGAVVSADGNVTVVISSSGGSGDPGFVAAWRLASDGKQVTVTEKGNWSGDEDAPAWASLPSTP